MIGKQGKIQEIHNFPKPETVNEVSDSTAQHQREREGKDPLILFQSSEENENAPNSDKGDRDKKKGTEASPTSAQDSESSSCIPDVDKIEESLNHLYPLIENQRLLNHVLGPLIHQENPETDEEKNPVFTLHG